MIKRPTNKQLNQLIHEVESTEDIDCTSSIMNLIKCGKLEMKSRWMVLTEYFGLRITWVLFIIFVAAIINLLLFSISQSPEWGFIGFGGAAFGLLVKNLPYGWIALVMASVVLLIVIMKQFPWSYILPLRFYAVILTVGVILVGGAAFASGINEAFYEKFVEEPGASTSLLGKIYCIAANKSLDSNRAMIGEVVYCIQHDLVIQTPEMEIVTVKMNNEVWKKNGCLEPLQVIKMIGERNGNEFIATHVKVYDEKRIRILRDKEDCINKEKWQHKNEVVRRRRQVAEQPMMPRVGTVQLIQSIR